MTVFDLQKAKKEIIFLSISLLLLFAFILGLVIFKKSDDTEETELPEISTPNTSYLSVDFSDKYYYNQLSFVQQREFSKIYEAVKNYEDSVVVEGLSVQDLNRIIYILHFDCPEFFYLSDTEQNFNHKGNKATTYYPKYTYTKDTIEKMNSEIRMAVYNISSTIVGKSQTETEKYIHDYLVSNVTYNKDTENCTNIYGALIEGKANCKGYSSAFTFIARECGLQSAQVIGLATEADASVGHSWNIVELGEHYYYLDVCWDDFDNNEQYGGLSGAYIFYNLPADKMSLSHNSSKTMECLGNPPTDRDSAQIYYKKAGFYAFDLESAKNIIRNGLSRVNKGESDYIIMQCDTQELYKTVMENIQMTVKSEIEAQGYQFDECELVEISKSNAIILVNFSFSE